MKSCDASPLVPSTESNDGDWKMLLSNTANIIDDEGAELAETGAKSSRSHASSWDEAKGFLGHLMPTRIMCPLYLREIASGTASAKAALVVKGVSECWEDAKRVSMTVVNYV